MTNPIRGSRTDEPSASLKLRKEHRELLVDLILTASQVGNTNAQAVYEALKGRLQVSLEFVTVLREGLRRSLADPGYLAVWIEQVRKLRNGLLPFDELDESFVQVLLADGPAGIEDLGRLAFFALSPDQLEVVHGDIVEALPPFWIDAVEDAMSQSARERGTRRRSTAELLEEVEQRIADKLNHDKSEEHPVAIDFDTHIPTSQLGNKVHVPSDSVRPRRQSWRAYAIGFASVAAIALILLWNTFSIRQNSTIKPQIALSVQPLPMEMRPPRNSKIQHLSMHAIEMGQSYELSFASPNTYWQVMICDAKGVRLLKSGVPQQADLVLPLTCTEEQGFSYIVSVTSQVPLLDLPKWLSAKIETIQDTLQSPKSDAREKAQHIRLLEHLVAEHCGDSFRYAISTYLLSNIP